jgi:6-pyruvoyl-tetrahydropterin synthase
MFRLVVREHIMIAHSFKGEVFGPAQKLHGATFVVDLELSRPSLDEHGIVCDIGLLSELLASVLKPLNYQNLDELVVFEGQNTTTEVLAQHIAERVAAKIGEGALGAEAGAAMAGVKVTLGESHVAWASYERPL